MFQGLHVINLALINEAELEFGKGLHILTGETGAGKSLLLGSVNLALGGKASGDMIGARGEYALSELQFKTDNSRVNELLKELELPIEEEGIILQRRISAGRSTCRINSESVPASKVRQLAEHLIDIHGQHEHQSLLKSSNHISILDEYIGSEADKELSIIGELHSEYRRIKNELSEADTDEREREREIALIEHELSEIISANLKPGEDEELEKEYEVMKNFQRIKEHVMAAAGALGSERSDAESVSDMVGRALRELTQALSYDDRLKMAADTLRDAEEVITQAENEIKSYYDDMSFDEEGFYCMQERLNVINHLKSRYGRSIEEILEYAGRAEEKLERFRDYDTYMEGLKEKLKAAKEKLTDRCQALTEIRAKGAAAFEKDITKALLELNFNQVVFKVQIDSKECSANGADEIEFMISMNPGEKVRPLSEVASGGELSRIMLAIRSVGADRDGIETLIFDEIDAGISGRTASQVAKKLYELSRNRQVICITHLPQIAAFADHHYKIEKSTDGSTTQTDITKLNEESSLEELVRLLGDTKSAYENAKELRNQAQEYKEIQCF